MDDSQVFATKGVRKAKAKHRNTYRIESNSPTWESIGFGAPREAIRKTAVD